MSDFADVLGLKPLGALGYFKLNPITLCQALETFALNLRVMYEDILPLILRNKTEPLGIIEPFNRSCLHFQPSLF